jgi:biopolymer transport protein ExbD
MTSLVDVLTVLVFFLLKNFSTEGDIITPSEGLELPISTSQQKPEPVLVVAISQKHIMAEGKPVALVGEEMTRAGTDIPALAEWLGKRKSKTETIAQYDPSLNFEGKLTIQGDKTIPWKLLEKVLHTCGQSGYSNFALAVTREDEK